MGHLTSLCTHSLHPLSYDFHAIAPCKLCFPRSLLASHSLNPGLLQPSLSSVFLKHVTLVAAISLFLEQALSLLSRNHTPVPLLSLELPLLFSWCFTVNVVNPKTFIFSRILTSSSTCLGSHCYFKHTMILSGYTHIDKQERNLLSFTKK